MLKQHTLLYDADCPLCKLYSRAFIVSGMLDERGRSAYQQLPEALCPVVDRQRAVNEIALVNTVTGEVSYGIHSLLKVIGHSFPVLKPLFGWRPFIWLMSKLYAFISYNRRVIIPVPAKDAFEIQPAFRLDYRIAYLVFTWLITALILTEYAPLLKGTVPVGHALREYLICGGQILLQGVIVSLYAPHQRWNYLGNMMTISLGGALLLLAGLLVSGFADLPSIAWAAYFMLVAGLMFLEHIRRTKLMELGLLLTITWMVYRLLVLSLIFIYN